MKILKISFVYFLFLSLLAGMSLGSCAADNSSKLKIMTSTSLMEGIVKQAGGNLVEVTNLVPPNQHPGNFDIKPGDVQKLANAALFLLHGWPGEGYADKLIASANNPSLTVVKIGVDGNWMIPSVQSQAVQKVVAALSEKDPGNAEAYRKAGDNYLEEIRKKEKEIQERLADVKTGGNKIIASARQADFLQWAGFDVIASFNSPQELTPQKIRELIDAGKAAGAVLVVNNLQDSKDAGQPVAQELGVKNVNLSNFPGGYDDTETWEKAIDYNADILLKALAK